MLGVQRHVTVQDAPGPLRCKHTAQRYVRKLWQNLTGERPCHHWEESTAVLSYKGPILMHIICVTKPLCLYPSTEHSVDTYPGQGASACWVWAILSEAAISTAFIECPLEAEDWLAPCYLSFFIWIIIRLSILLNTGASWIRAPLRLSAHQTRPWVQDRGCQE